MNLKLIKKLFVLMICIVTVNQLKAQDPTNYVQTNLIPPSPTVNSLGKFGQTPINLSTGVVSTSIPLFVLEGKELKLPITLSYSYDGFKPSQSVGWAGLGWNIQAGGVITRMVNGAVDNTFNYGYNYEDPAVQALINSPSYSYEFLKAGTNMLYDLEPDIFQFNFGKYSGKFMLVNGNFYCFPYQKLSISGSENGFLIITEDGTRYSFNEKEYTSAKGDPNAPYTLPSHISSWHLSSISTPSENESITFQYEDEGSVITNGTLTQTFKKKETLTPLGQDVLTPIKGTYPVYISSKRLVSIKSDKHAVYFNAQDQRRDDLMHHIGGNLRAIKNIVAADNSGQIKKWNFNMGYFGASSPNGKYLKLVSLTEEPGVTAPGILETPGISSKTHLFEYEEDAVVPNKYDAMLDHYGYYKTGVFSGVLLPDFIYPTTGPNRDPNLEGTKLGALKKITYPTGGTTTFEYELNKTFKGNNYVPEGASANTFIEWQPAYLNGEHYGSNYVFFSLDQEQDINIFLKRTVKVVSLDSLAKNKYADFKIYKVSGGLPLANPVYEDMIGHEGDNPGKLFLKTLPAGDYALCVFVDDKEDRMEADVSWTRSSGVKIEGGVVGGLRVKSITDHPLNGETLVKNFQYVNSDGFSSGSGHSGADYVTLAYKEIIFDGIGHEVNYLLTNSYISGRFDESVPFFYRTVFEEDLSTGAKLRTRHDFSSFSGYNTGIEEISTTKYKDLGTGYTPVQKTDYVYEESLDGVRFVGLKPYQTMSATILGGFWTGPTDAFDSGSNIYDQTWKYLKTVRDVVYTATDSVVSVTNHIYNPITRNLLLTRKQQSDGLHTVNKFKYAEDYVDAVSAPLKLKKILSVPLEEQLWKYKGTDSVLVAAHLTSFDPVLFKPAKKYLLRGEEISGLNNETKTGTLYNNLISDTRYEEMVNYNYGAGGELNTQQLTNGVPISYQWGYASVIPTRTVKNYPVAEAKNASVSEFFTQNFEEDNTATNGDAHTGAKYHLGTYTVNWAIPNTRSYVISYFYRSGGKWIFKKQPYLGTLTLSDGDAIDDIVIYPADASIRTFTYLAGGNLGSVTETNGYTSRFEYDLYLRLLNVLDDNKHIIKSYAYNYGGSGGGTTPPESSMINISYYNYCVLDAGNQPSAGVGELKIKDGTGNVVYTFTEAQLQAGVSIATGTYTFEYTTYGVKWKRNSPSGNIGWLATYLEDNDTLSYLHTVQNDERTSNVYVVNGVTVSHNLNLYIDRFMPFIP
ncbi:hypothetical protein [Pedobacter montanisoli]|uniref:YD repeat-containing protein n=1 Tax=Pedobacter montanisoli TaxID=2923277 RepID=A0ABS9ZZH8_9SPHI|nr:hypothetical protein [Pedobacter montanisoli]MCJ0743675.1 hypothetical protein [Pedobacter montanisoli]